MKNLFRSLVFVPGNNPRFLEKAKLLSSDIVCFDLEDSVPEKEKQKARNLISKKLKEHKDFKHLFLLERIHHNLEKSLMI
tara:strand:- start:83 stop:322 length:240 start_codon:yes stop_codon:yes gene_type:complete